MPAGKRFYWVGLKTAILTLCKYNRLWRRFLPSDLPEEVTALLALADAACMAIEAYDKLKKGGKKK